MDDEVKLDWSSAEVRDGKLVIALEGKLHKAWADAFERTTHLLNHGRWKKVKLKKGSVQIRPIAPGEEDAVHHFLESVVLQANSAIEAEAMSGPTEDTDGSKEKGAREAPEDQEMTRRLRSFAEDENGS
jgi:hypothetical protein